MKTTIEFMDSVTINVSSGSYFPRICELAKAIIEATGVTVHFEFNEKKYTAGFVRMYPAGPPRICLQEIYGESIYL